MSAVGPPGPLQDEALADFYIAHRRLPPGSDVHVLTGPGDVITRFPFETQSRLLILAASERTDRLDDSEF